MPPRRSTRANVAEKPKQESSLVSDDSDFVGEEEASGEERKGRGKKRKAPANPKRAPKKVRGIKGKLKAMVEMPIDILFEIFSKLDPIDLVHLARTNKDLWAILSSPSSISVWKAARSNIVPTLPDCGEEMSEMQYADLLFGKGCQYCLRNIGTIHRAFFPRKRICNKCLDQQCTSDLVDIPSWLSRVLCPHIVIQQTRKRNRETTYFFVDLLEIMMQEARERNGTDNNNREWLNKRLLKRLKHAKLCENWAEESVRHRAAIANQVVEERKSRIAERVKELGWADEVALNPRSAFQDHPDIVMLCQKPLLPHILSGLDPSINDYMERLQQKRLSKEPLEAFQKGFPVLRRVRDELIATLPVKDRYGKLHAMAEELALEPAIMNIILNHPKDTAIMEEDLLPTAATIFPDLNNRVRNRANEELLSIAEKGYKAMGQDRAINHDIVLDLATTIFACVLRHTQPEWYDGIIDHPYTKNANFPDTMQDSARAIIHCGGKYRSHTKNVIFARESTIEFASYLIELCGLDPLTTTKKTMDEMNPIFEAVWSNSETSGRATMTWSRAIQHHLSHYGKVPEKTQYELLRGEEMEHARSRIAEARNRALFGGYNRPKRICAHCGDISDSALKMFNDHLAKSHGIVSPTDKDFTLVPVFGEDNLPPIFWMWPPRLD